MFDTLPELDNIDIAIENITHMVQQKAISEVT